MVALKRFFHQRSGPLCTRSRNAVVALKLSVDSSKRNSYIKKQERRGGIETFATPILTNLWKSEAGTPWWH